MTREEQIAKWAGLFVGPDQVTELRALRVNGSETWSGFFKGSDLRSLACAALQLETVAGGVYFVPNPVNAPARAKLGVVKQLMRGEGTTDEMVAARRWLLVDIDPVRFGIDGRPIDSDCPSTDAEREAAWQVLSRSRGALEAFGLTGGIIGDSGNGYHLCYPVELPNDDAARTLHRFVLATLEARGGDTRAHVDLKTFNAARIWKLYGTQARKGVAAGGRAWRYTQAVVLAGPAGDPKANTAALRRAAETWEKQDRLRTTGPTPEPGAYGRKALELETAKVLAAAPGTRNNTLNAAAFALGQLVAGGELARDAVEAALLAAAASIKLTRAEAVATVRSGIDAGGKEPRKAPESKGAAAAASTKAAEPPAAAAPAAPPPDAGISCADLMAMDLPEVRFAVPGLLPEGLTILAGRPKARKSWFALQLALGVALGEPVLAKGTGAAKPAEQGADGKIITAGGHVLYLALEDTRRRLKKRVQKILTAKGWAAPAALEFRIQSDRLPAGLAPIEAWLKARPEARLIIVDTLQKVRPAQKAGNKDGYADDYAVLSDIKALADRHAVSVLVLHHSRKASADSPFDEISGTLGLTGAADGMFLLQRDHDADTAALYMTGRDIEEETLTLAWDDAGCLWSIDKRESGINREPQGDRPPPNKAPRLAKCVEWVKQRLIHAPMRWSALQADAANVDKRDGGPFDDKLLSRSLKGCAIRFEDEKRGVWYRLPESDELHASVQQP